MEQPASDFYGLGIAPKLIETLTRLKFKTPTSIQHKVIPIALEGKDLIGIAQTGTGKTISFAVPTVQQLSIHKFRALVLVPTRELALQVEETFIKIASRFGIRTVSLIGGDPIRNQIRILQKLPRVLIATPGRLLDFLEQKKIRLHDIGILVLDEADRMLDMGFAPQIEEIFKNVNPDRQTMFFSATMPAAIMKMVAHYMKAPVCVEVAPSGTAAQHLTHELFIVRHEMKKDLLAKLLDRYRGPILLFCRTKRGASRISRDLRTFGHSCAEIHSDRSLAQRRASLEGFRLGKYRVLVATDIASRGIDVHGIELVINYDLPDAPENYVHRVGRTGRAGRAGHAISLATPDQKRDILNIEQMIRMVLPVSQHPDIPSASFEKHSATRSFQKRSLVRKRPNYPSRSRKGTNSF